MSGSSNLSPRHMQVYLSWLEDATDNRDIGGSIPPTCTIDVDRTAIDTDKLK